MCVLYIILVYFYKTSLDGLSIMKSLLLIVQLFPANVAHLVTSAFVLTDLHESFHFDYLAFILLTFIYF